MMVAVATIHRHGQWMQKGYGPTLPAARLARGSGNHGSSTATSRSSTSTATDGTGDTCTETEILSEEYTVPAFIANVESWLPAYQNRFTTYNSQAGIFLTPDTDPFPAHEFQITKLQYKWRVNAGPGQVVNWIEAFTPTDGSPRSAVEKSWNPGPTATESPVYEIDPTARNARKNGTYMVLPLNFVKLWETENPANQIVVKARRDDPKDAFQVADADGNVYGAPRNLLYVTANPSDNKYHVSLDCDLGILRDQFVCAAYSNGTKVSGSDGEFIPSANSPALMKIPASGSGENGEDFVIRIAFDGNNNGLLDASETPIDLMAAQGPAGIPLPPKVRGFSVTSVNDANAKIQGQVTGTGWTGWKPNWLAPWFVPNAIALERLFYDFRYGSDLSTYNNTQPRKP
jgi:hypothetical protein